MREEVLGIKTMGEKINNLFKAAYKRHEIFVNRKYQRKLVWKLEEKQAFIDTLLRGYPVPLFLFAKTKTPKEREIIDGLQRLDAIFSFIKNEFPIMWEGKEQYCNKNALFCQREPFEQKKPVLDFDLCMSFGEYELPTTTTDFADTNTINEIFKRINSTGRKLAKQDLRQAGVVSNFSDLVRKTATEIRGDFTPTDYVDIFDMPAISLSDDGLEYGIEMSDMFWIKHDIINDTEIRKSKDEETLAQIFGYMILGGVCGVSSGVLDNMYDLDDDICKKVEHLLEINNYSYYLNKFLNVFHSLESVLEVSNTSFTNLLFSDRKTRGKSKIFITLFLAVYEIMEGGRSLGDPFSTVCSLKLAGDADVLKGITEKNHWSKGERDKAIQYFKQKLPTISVTKEESSVNENLIERLCSVAVTETETSMLEFKISPIHFKNGKLNGSVVDKIVKTFTAMNNMKSTKTGFIVLGVADNKKSAIAYDKEFNSTHVACGGLHLVGLQSEIDRFYNGDRDFYLRRFKEKIYKQPINDTVKERIVNNVFYMSYCNRLLLVIKCSYNGMLFRYDNSFYARHSCNTEKLEGAGDELITMLTKTDGKMLPVV